VDFPEKSALLDLPKRRNCSRIRERLHRMFGRRVRTRAIGEGLRASAKAFLHLVFHEALPTR